MGENKLQKPSLVDPNVSINQETPAPDPFDIESLRIDQSFADIGVKKLLTTVPVRKPGPQDFVRTNPDPGYRANLAVIELRDEREIFLLPPPMAAALPGEFALVSMFTAITRQGTLFLWPVKLPGLEGKELEWHRSAAEAAQMAMTHWVRMKANMQLGAYEMFRAESVIAEPQWPDLPFKELLRIGFKGRYVDNLEHAVIKRLRGA